jgi:hypothetical protein
VEPIDLDRRRPLWSALADMFLDTELKDWDFKSIANVVLSSGDEPADLRAILWKEVFPAIESNLRHPAGEWVGFSGEQLEKLILGPSPKQSPEQQPGTAQIIRKTWADVCQFLPGNYGIVGDPFPPEKS